MKLRHIPGLQKIDGINLSIGLGRVVSLPVD